jgi:hypothetical protein
MDRKKSTCRDNEEGLREKIKIPLEGERRERGGGLGENLSGPKTFYVYKYIILM